jgi:2-(1,2-epoxy-1,2-dihydrophenyl)acetyl-CoA isomerase
VSDVVVVSDEGHVRTVRMNRPEVKNAVNQELAWNVIGAIEEAMLDDHVWLVCLTGTGDAFCSGLDLRGSADYQAKTPQNTQLDDLGWVSQFLLTLRQKCEKPIIGGLNGVAVGAGLSLALATDIRLMKRSARILAGYPRIGGSPDGGMTFTLSQALGYEQTMRFLLESKTVDAEEALRLGLVGEVVDDDNWDARLQEYCQHLCSVVSPITMRLTKRTVSRATTAIDLEAQCRLELGSIRMAFASEDGKEARRAFMEKRPPVFTGQ